MDTLANTIAPDHTSNPLRSENLFNSRSFTYHCDENSIQNLPVLLTAGIITILHHQHPPPIQRLEKSQQILKSMLSSGANIHTFDFPSLPFAERQAREEAEG